MGDNRKDSFVLYTKYLTQVEKLDIEQRGILFTAILRYAAGESIPNMDSVTEMLWSIIEDQLQIDFEKYQKTCNARKEAGSRGGKARSKQNEANQANANFVKQSQANQADSDNECDSDNDSDNKKTMCKADADALFEKLWVLYPNKRGKGQISDANKRHLLDIGFERMARAIDRYKADLARDSWRKPQNGSTFFHSGYVDYLDENYTPPDPKSRTAGSAKTNKFNNFNQRNYDYNELERQLLNTN
ncbi:MAG: DUF6291 domain-containing protein [Lachnobacterium sp.]|nr:DUF6291 domain-containing protein [Lachnobacterium sp.]